MTVTKNGRFAGWDYNNPFPGQTTPSYNVNSNVPSASYNSPSSFNGRVNGVYQWDGQTQRGSFSSGARSVATGNRVATVAGKLATGVCAVSVGMQLGAKIDQTLYNIGKFFDLNPPEALNPESWADIATSEGGKDFIRTLFGIDSNGNTTMYMPEDAINYLYKYWNNLNAFDGGMQVANYDPPQGVDISGVPGSLTLISSGPYVVQSGTYYKEFYFTDAEYIVPVMVNGGKDIIAISRNAYPTVHFRDSPDGQWDTFTTTSNSTTLEDSQLFHPNSYISLTSAAFPGSWSDYGLPDNVITSTSNTTAKIGTVILDGSVTTTGGVPGFEPNPDSTMVDPSQVGQNPVTQAYPQLFQNPIKESVPQADGSTRDIVYYPVPWPNISDVDRPISSTSDQTDPEVSDDSPEDEKEPLTDVITNPVPQTDTPTPGDEATPPDTGSGSTPTVIAPTGNASSLWAIYNPTQAQLDAFGSWLWSSNFVEQIKKLFNDPMQAIVGVHKVFATPSTGAQVNIKCGYIDSGCPAAAVTSQYTTIDCGTVSLREYYGNVFDYAPYTEVHLYLPFIGIVKLDVADVMRSSIKVKYHVDVITGACLADVIVNRDGENAVLYQYAGSAIVTYPISSGSYASMAAGVLSLAAGVAGTIATGGAAAPALIGGAVGLSHLHTDVQKSGSFSGSPGAMGCKKPYLIVSRVQDSMPSNFQKYEGKPASKAVKLGDCDGYIKVKEINIDGVPATYGELDQIVSLLKSGVII